MNTSVLAILRKRDRAPWVTALWLMSLLTAPAVDTLNLVRTIPAPGGFEVFP